MDKKQIEKQIENLRNINNFWLNYIAENEAKIAELEAKLEGDE